MILKPGIEEAYQKAIQLDPEGPDDTPGINAYAQATIEYATRWADLMESAMIAGETLEQCADRCSHEADTDGITGNMYGMAASILSTYWGHGTALKKWHNGKYGRPDAEGVVNPAILVISEKEG